MEKTGPERLREFLQNATEEELAEVYAASDAAKGVGPTVSEYMESMRKYDALVDLVETCQRMVLRGYSGNDIPVDTSRISWGWDHPDIQEIRRCLEAMGAMPLPIKELEDKMMEGYDADHQ